MTSIQALEMMKTHLVTVRDNSTLSDAVDRMDLYQVDELPVLNEEAHLCGWLRETDIAAAFRIDDIQAAASYKIIDLMQQPPPTVKDTDLITQELITTLLATFRRMPVVDAGGKLIGTLNRVDIIQALLENTMFFN